VVADDFRPVRPGALRLSKLDRKPCSDVVERVGAMRKFVLLALMLLMGCERQQKDQPWLGYGEGDFAYISAPQAGWVTQMKVERGTEVHRGDLLFVLDSTKEQAGTDQAQAQLAQARANLRQENATLAYARTTLDRQNRLARDNAGTPTERD